MGAGAPPARARRRGRVGLWWTAARQWLGAGTAGTAAAERLPRGFLVFLLLFGAGMILISLVGDQGLIAYLRLQADAETLGQDIRTLKERHRRVQYEIKALQEDPAYIELMARQRLGLVRPGDTVIQLPPLREAP